MLRAFALLAPIALAWLALPSSVLAQANADALIDEGVALREQGRDAEALERFQRAHELSPSGRALAQQALAEQALGRWVEAHDHLVAALEDTAHPWIAANRAALQGALERIREHVAHLELVDGVPGAEVRINGARAGVLPLARPLIVPAGTVVLEVRAPGHVAFQRTIQVRGGGRARESVVLVPSGRPDDDLGGDANARAGDRVAPVLSVASGPDTLSIAGASVLGAAGLAGVVAAIVGIAGAGCVALDGPTCIEERTTNWVGVGVYGGAGLAAVVGAVIWLAVAVSGGPVDEGQSALRLTPDGFAWSF